MKQQQPRRYKQFAGFPGANGVVGGSSQGPKQLRPLTDAERAEIERLGIPRDPEQPHAYTPPPGAYTRKIGIELLGPLGLVAVVLLLFSWLLSTPASGEHAYYTTLLSGGAGSGEHASGEEH